MVFLKDCRVCYPPQSPLLHRGEANGSEQGGDSANAQLGLDHTD